MSCGMMEMVDAHTKLAGSNRMEILLFGLGGEEVFGINVFKVREVCQAPRITPTPNAPAGVEGVYPCAAPSSRSSPWRTLFLAA